MSTSAVSEAKPRLPPSATHYGLNCIGLLLVLVSIYALRVKWIHVPDPVMFLAGAVIVPVVLLDVLVLRVHRRESTGLDWDRTAAIEWRRVGTKLLGFVFTLLPFAAAYWTFPEYGGTFYEPYYNLFKRFGPGLAAASVLYFVVIDGHMKEPYDAYWQVGRAVLGKWGDAKRWDVANHYRGWLVKAYFFPLMFVWLNNSTHNVVNFDLSNVHWDNLRLYDFLYDFIFFVDLLYATVGYAICFKPIDTHLRTAEPTFLGWGVALFCYEPFFSGLFEKQYVRYGGVGFGNWLAPHLGLRWAWSAAIILLIAIYVAATVAFGVRFSNLTHRGILTNGPYRFTKHPAYVSKNLSWWLASVPFVMNDSFGNAVKRCLMLGVVNFMYFMRARTEERHLSRDPVYVAYALWMNDNGWLRFLNRIPFFRYKPPVAAPATEETRLAAE